MLHLMNQQPVGHTMARHCSPHPVPYSSQNPSVLLGALCPLHAPDPLTGPTWPQPGPQWNPAVCPEIQSPFFLQWWLLNAAGAKLAADGQLWVLESLPSPRRDTRISAAPKKFLLVKR